ncbi:FadR/GntR family transcriptional regulator [Thermomicrobium sp. 4228-Ro]|uniref:FadR/GntR family transcriptional regulator n=1 Tax=Thermomicrobium sp. 4228-Ro TaxID=2993937 RepID=UPI00224996BB|nr:FadR/GntR family transcriptional regulator [Thermomicrobium sp. 4228-Ro]MCX2728521.1 FadR/GntR family transcriptional regulator [Thermomicrobium sp. 4228-Ro]
MTREVWKLPTQVAIQLGRQILTVAHDPGATLPSEQEICAQYDVSRTVAREAMQLLGSLDIVRISSGRRMTLRPPEDWNYLHPLMLEILDPVEVRRLLADLHEVRLMIEPVVAARAAQRIGMDQLHRLEAILGRMRALESDPDRYLEYDLQFHAEICNVLDNRVLHRILYSCRWLLMASRRVTNRLWASLAAVTEEHERIFRALAQQDPQAAEAAMRSHLEGNARAWSLPPDLMVEALEHPAGPRGKPALPAAEASPRPRESRVRAPRDVGSVASAHVRKERRTR